MPTPGTYLSGRGEGEEPSGRRPVIRILHGGKRKWLHQDQAGAKVARELPVDRLGLRLLPRITGV